MTHRVGSPIILSRWLVAGAAALACWSGLSAAAAAPILSYSTLVGGTGLEIPFAIAVDANHEVVITGQADAAYPTTPGAYDRTSGGIFVTRLNASGTALVYSTFLGPGRGTGVAIFGGHAYVTGRTRVSFATPGAVNHFEPLGENGFVAKLKADGSGLVWAAFFGGVSEDPHIAIDAAGNVYVSGTTTAPNFPVTAGAFQATRPTLPAITGDRDAFFLKLDPTGSTLLYATYLASDQLDEATGIAVDAAGMAYVSGFTEGRVGAWDTFPAATLPFPTTASAYQKTFTGTQSAFVTKFDPTQSGPASMVYSTLLGNQGLHQAHGIAVDAAGNAYVSGSGESNFPLTPGSYGVATLQSGGAFVTKLNASGSGLVYSAMIPAGSAGRIALDASNNAFVGGVIPSASVFVPVNPLPGITGEGFLAKLDATGSVAEYSTRMQGRGVMALAVDPAGAAYALGDVHQTAFIATPGAYQSAINGTFPDLFVAKVATNQPPVANAGNDQSIFLGQSFNLDGTASSDPEGQPLSYVWRDAGNNVIGNGPTSSRGPLPQGQHIFSLTVSDGLLTDTDAVMITSNAALSMNFFGLGSGRVVSNDGKVNCHSTTYPCPLALYSSPTGVTLTAIPDTGSFFFGWVLQCTGTGFCTHTVDRNIVEGARFDIQQVTLSVTPPGNGKVTSPSHPAIDCGTACSVDVAFGTEVELKATPDDGYLFANWIGDCVVTGDRCKVTLQAAKTVSATFTEITLTSIAMSPASATLAVGEKRRLKVIGTFSDGSMRELSADRSVDGSDDDTCAILRNGTVKCFGAAHATPTVIPHFYQGVSLIAGTFQFCARFGNGVNCDGSFWPLAAPTMLASNSPRACALLEDGSVSCFSAAAAPSPQAYTGTGKIIAIGADGAGSVCAVRDSGSVSCSDVDPPVAGVTNATAVVVGAMHACALIADGRVMCWGNNNEGQLGRGTLDPIGTPMPAGYVLEQPGVPLSDVITITSGDYQLCALKRDTTVKCWGRLLGSGSPYTVPVIIQPPAGRTTVAIAAGAFHSCATYSDGTLGCWGYNQSNTLGAGTPSSLTPTLMGGMTNLMAMGWRAGNGLVGEVTGSGLAMARNPGTFTVTAMVSALTASAVVTVLNTAPGSNVSVTPVDAATGTSPVTVTFSNVSQPGETTVVINPGGPPALPTTRFELGTPSVYYDISTTATYTPPITICIGYGGISFPGTPKLFHFEGGAWVDVTTSFDTSLRRVCGQVSSLSPFALMVPANSAPIARAGPDRTLECTAPQTPVTLDGSASSDANLDPLTYRWTGIFGTKQGAVATVNLPLGLSTATLTVSDGRASSSDTVQITVRDSVAPAITAATASPAELWPPNHKLVPVTVSASASDRCDAAVRCRIESVAGNEPVDGLGDGDTAPDWQLTGDLTVLLRAERSGQGNGRTYSINLRCLDASGNGSSRVIPVTVPKNR